MFIEAAPVTTRAPAERYVPSVTADPGSVLLRWSEDKILEVL